VNAKITIIKKTTTEKKQQMQHLSCTCVQRLTKNKRCEKNNVKCAKNKNRPTKL